MATRNNVIPMTSEEWDQIVEFERIARVHEIFGRIQAIGDIWVAGEAIEIMCQPWDLWLRYTKLVQWLNQVIDRQPTIVCLCGSGRFTEEYEAANIRETLAGNIVLTIGVSKHHDSAVTKAVQGSAEFREFEASHSYPECVDWLNERYAKINSDLDELHKRKIDIADEILVLNVGGYIGNSTRSEIEYAKVHGKGIRYLEPITVS